MYIYRLILSTLRWDFCYHSLRNSELPMVSRRYVYHVSSCSTWFSIRIKKSNKFWSIHHCCFYILQHMLAKLLIEVLCLGKDSADSNRLLNYKAPKAAKGVCYMSQISINSWQLEFQQFHSILLKSNWFILMVNLETLIHITRISLCLGCGWFCSRGVFCSQKSLSWKGDTNYSGSQRLSGRHCNEQRSKEEGPRPQKHSKAPDQHVCHWIEVAHQDDCQGTEDWAQSDISIHCVSLWCRGIL